MLVGGLILGVATPTELGALTVVYAVALGFWYRELTWKDVFEAASETLIFCGVLVFIIAAAVPFGWLISFTTLAGRACVHRSGVYPGIRRWCWP